MKATVHLILGIICFGALFVGCGGSEPQKSDQNELQTASFQSTEQKAALSLPSTVVAVVNGSEIKADELRERVHTSISQIGDPSNIDEYTFIQLRENALQELIKTHLIAQKAEELHVAISEKEFHEYIQQVQQEYEGTDIRDILQEQGQVYEEWEREQRHALLLEKLVDLTTGSMITVSAEEVYQYYERHKEEYDRPDQARAYQILTYEEPVAQKALREIQDGGDFAEVARKYSESPDAGTGGDLGFFGQGVMPVEFDMVIASLEIGAVSDVIKTPYGYQIFKLVDRREAHRLSFEEAQASIIQKLKTRKQTFATDLWIAELQNHATVERNYNAIKQVK